MANFLEEGKYIDVIDTGLTYIGYAWPSTKPSDKKWKIKRITTVGTLTKIEYALPLQGANTMTDYFIFAWDDRTSLTLWG
jgi:hypothetical protein